MRKRHEPAADAPANGAADERGDFTVGERVRIGGIGPEMVLTEYCSGDAYSPEGHMYLTAPARGWVAAWFVQGALRRATFPAAALRRVEAKAAA